jgi:hypothetical protein
MRAMRWSHRPWLPCTGQMIIVHYGFNNSTVDVVEPDADACPKKLQTCTCITHMDGGGGEVDPKSSFVDPKSSFDV